MCSNFRSGGGGGGRYSYQDNPCLKRGEGMVKAEKQLRNLEFRSQKNFQAKTIMQIEKAFSTYTSPPTILLRSIHLFTFVPMTGSLCLLQQK